MSDSNSDASRGSSAWPCLQTGKHGVVLALSVVPGASRTELVGLHGETLRVRLAAQPVDGKANEALLAWLAQSLGVPRRQVSLLRGETSRRKHAALDVEVERVRAWLERSLGAG